MPKFVVETHSLGTIERWASVTVTADTEDEAIEIVEMGRTNQYVDVLVTDEYQDLQEFEIEGVTHA